MATGDPYVYAGNTTADIKSAILTKPVSALVEAGTLEFLYYKGGVITAACGHRTDHAIIIVGWGNDVTYGDYWIV